MKVYGNNREIPKDFVLCLAQGTIEKHINKILVS